MKAVSAWSRWAFTPIDTAPMAALRIAMGLMALGWALAWLPDVDAFLSDDGLTPTPSFYPDAVPHTFPLEHPTVVVLALAVAAIALTVGWHTRVAAIVVTALMIWIERRAPLALNSGDVLLRNLSLYVALMPAGELWSLDARRRARESRLRLSWFGPRPPALRAPWGLRLLQVQISVLYAAAVMAKLRGDTWNDGTAVGLILQLGDLQRFVVPDAITHSLLASTLMTYGTLVMETVLVFGLWFARTRKWAAIGGIAMHLTIDATIAVGWFSIALIACYLAFVPPEQLRALVARFRRDEADPAAVREPVSLVKPTP